MAVDKQAYREAMARLGAAVNVITTDGPAGRTGFTASAVCSVTDTPPTLLVCANRTNDSYPAMKTNAVLCVNTLAGPHEGLSPVFAGMTDHTMEARFDGATWHRLATAMPMGSWSGGITPGWCEWSTACAGMCPWRKTPPRKPSSGPGPSCLVSNHVHPFATGYIALRSM